MEQSKNIKTDLNSLVFWYSGSSLTIQPSQRDEHRQAGTQALLGPRALRSSLPLHIASGNLKILYRNSSHMPMDTLKRIECKLLFCHCGQHRRTRTNYEEILNTTASGLCISFALNNSIQTLLLSRSHLKSYMFNITDFLLLSKKITIFNTILPVNWHFSISCFIWKW